MMEQEHQSSGMHEQEDRGASRVVMVLITAVLFFVLGYGAAWLALGTAVQGQAGLRETVRTAVAESFAALDLRAEAAPTQEAPTVLEVSVDDDPAFGPEDAPITIVEFSDFRCGFCGRFHAQTYGPLMQKYEGLIRFVYRDFPVVGGERAALAAECVHDQGEDLFWAYHDVLFANQQSLTSDEALVSLAADLGVDTEAMATCLADELHADEVQKDFTDGMALGVRGTPAFFINGRPVIGAQPLAVFQQIIDAELAAPEAG
ncbi:MAG: DsbA family protein [Anaerolineae bacterium]|nr:DsbA family protein [Anaerolineae bacterium]